jgi:hypothetical protein
LAFSYAAIPAIVLFGRECETMRYSNLILVQFELPILVWGLLNLSGATILSTLRHKDMGLHSEGANWVSVNRPFPYLFVKNGEMPLSLTGMSPNVANLNLIG